jgi:hypothetical protein
MHSTADNIVSSHKTQIKQFNGAESPPSYYLHKLLSYYYSSSFIYLTYYFYSFSFLSSNSLIVTGFFILFYFRFCSIISKYYNNNFRYDEKSILSTIIINTNTITTILFCLLQRITYIFQFYLLLDGFHNLHIGVKQV